MAQRAGIAIQLPGVTRIAPLMGIVANPGVIQSNEWLRRAYAAGGFNTIAS
ncbi:MAG: hypothetical protein K8J08_21835 [Thermoanaerobaculia bacterium]|nr:hypothetical protein [Thermoanaerobaculia bacterium]